MFAHSRQTVSVVMPAGHGLDLACVNIWRAGVGRFATEDIQHSAMPKSETDAFTGHYIINKHGRDRPYRVLFLYLYPPPPSPYDCFTDISLCNDENLAWPRSNRPKKKNNIAKKRAVVSEGRAHIQLATYLIVIILETPN